MRLAFAILVVLVVIGAVLGCKTREKKPAAPAGPTAVARCDYHADVLGGKNHTCQEAYVESQSAALEAWCNKLVTPRDHPTFSKEGCPVEGRKGGCLYPNGSVRWTYAGDSSCIGGLEFKDQPKRQTSMPYRCSNDRLCREYQSVFDLTKTVEAKNCETGASVFSAGSCSADHVTARCVVQTNSDDTIWLFYTAVSIDQAKTTCAELEGVFAQ